MTPVPAAAAKNTKNAAEPDSALTWVREGKDVPGQISALVLVADSSTDGLEHLGHLLADRCFEVRKAGLGAEVPALLARENFLAVFCEEQLPDVSGLSLLKKVRRLRPDVPVVILSSGLDFGRARRILREGALDVLQRPVDAEELDEVLERARDFRQQEQRAAELQRQARRRLTDLVLLSEIGKTANSEESLQDLFRKIVDSISLAAEVNIVSLMVQDADGLMRIKAAKGLSDPIMKKTRVAPGEGISGYVLASGEAVLIDDISRDSRFSPSGGGDRYQTLSLLSVPIRCRDRVIGVLNVNNKRSGETFTAEDRNLLLTIAHQAALAIENFKLVTHLQIQARELEQANRDLRRLNSARTRLICNLSHELRTPLTSVLGYLDLLCHFDRHIDTEDVRDYIEKAHESSQHLEKIVGGMLKLFSLDSGSETWTWSALSLEPLVYQVLMELDAKIKEIGLSVDLDFTDPLSSIYGDREKVVLVLRALLDNAVKFNRTGGALVIKAANVSLGGLDHVRLRIHNDGKAIPTDVQDVVFDQYSQLGDMNTQKPDGLGIGLALVRTILRHMKGQITLEACDSEGTTFTVFFPARESFGALNHDREHIIGT